MRQSISSRLQGKSRSQDEEKATKGIEDAKDEYTPPENVYEAILELQDHQRKDWARWRDKEYAIIPHTDAGGDAYFIGDFYEGIKCANEWEMEEPGPYLQYVKDLSETMPHLAYLGHWMEVTCAPPKWRYMKFFDENRRERRSKAHVCVIDYTDGGGPETETYNNTEELLPALTKAPQTAESRQTRLLIVEDLSRDLVEGLGAFYDIDPLFFLSYIGDYLFHNTRDPWVELPNLDVDLRKQNHFIIQYLRARYFPTEKQYQAAEMETGNWNILRRLDSDRSRKRLQNGLLDKKDASVVLTRAKTSLWIKPRQAGDPVTAILLLDPTVSTGQPLWGGYRPFEGTPSMAALRSNREKAVQAPKRQSLFDDMKYWSLRLSSDDLNRIRSDERCIALPMYRLVIADWLTTLKYMTTQLGKIEWEFEKPHWGENASDISDVLQKLSPWRRNVGYYQTMISEASARLFPPEVHAPYHGLQSSTPALSQDSTSREILASGTDKVGIIALLVDFKNVKRQMDEIQVRIKSIENMATNNINIEESRRAVKQNKNLARLTFLAALFIPLQFTSSFLSISPDFTQAKQSIWLFFVIGIPLTLIVLLAIELTHPEQNSWTWSRCKAIKRQWRAYYGTGKKPETPMPTPPPQQHNRRKSVVRKETTVPWITSRNDTKHE
ncbi:hypothetical protein CLAFUW4_11160 [Fulvia fulva]|nr:hypothetical protein CLAFUR4_11165 [Fulvia fulva]KAK4620420.1 hypothetical protein CLAFUR0_11170 [Fulvia fulva]WPV17316.1 hypothetical protein CLAFUW4_11160 [Fulvia fulva]WPV32326.1 hypothetical protein CLAFUW7_11156 [Fulvia fulva]